MNWNKFAKEVHQNAVEKDWWDKPVSWDDFIVMCHCELSEAVEEYRKGRPNVYRVCEASDGKVCDLDVDGCCTIAPGDPCEHRGAKPEGVAVELADCVLRILDWLAQVGYDINAEIGSHPAFPEFIKTVCLCHKYLSKAHVQATALSGPQEAAHINLIMCIEVIRDWFNQSGVDLEAVLREKLEYNKRRPYRHGGKKL